MQTALIEEAYRSIAELTSDYVSVSRMEPDGGSVLEWVTPGFYEWTGYRPEELPERDPWAALIHPDDMEVIRRHRARIFGGHDDTCEMRIRTRDGRTRWLRSTTRPKWDDREGRVTLVFAAGRDITREKESIERLRIVSFAVEQTGEGIAVADLQGNLLMVNPAFAAMHGYRPDELLGRHLSIFHTPEQMPAVEEANRLIRGTGEFYGEIWHARRDGTVFPSLMHNSVLRDEAGRFTGMVGTMIDLTEIRRQEQALRESEERLRQIAENITDVFWVVSPDWSRVHYISPAYEKLWGRSLQSLYDNPRSWMDGIHEDDRAKVVADIEKRKAGQSLDSRGPESRVVRPDGSVRWMQARSFPVLNERGEVYRVAGILEDITERKLAEEALRRAYEELEARVQERTAELAAANAALRESEERFRTLTAAVPIPMVVTRESDGVILYANPLAAEALRVGQGQIIGHRAGEFYVEPVEFATMRTGVQAKGGLQQYERHGRRADGSTFWVLASSQRMVYEGQAAVISGFHDISDRKRAEEALSRQTALLSGIVANIPAGVFWKNRDSVYEGCNNVFAVAAGLASSEEIVGKTDYDLAWTTEQSDWYRTCDQEVMDGDKPTLLIEETQRQADGTEIVILTNKVPRHDASGRVCGILGVFTDITERRQAEELARRRGAEVAHMSRLSVMGEMATELAHEVNQPLAAIGNYARGCVRRLESGEYAAGTLLEAVRQIVAEADRADEVIRRIRDFARRRETARSTSDLNAIVRQAVQFVEYEAKSRDIRVRFEPSASIPPMEIDGIQIQQVLLNLFRNAIDAMANTEGRPRCLRVTTAMDGGDTVRVTVSDTGEAFTPDRVEAVFEPFYTTKSEGTGLGLSISRSIIQAHGGRLWAELNDGPGATFHFTLPVTAAVP